MSSNNSKRSSSASGRGHVDSPVTVSAEQVTMTAVRDEWNSLSASAVEVSRKVAVAVHGAFEAGLIGKGKHFGTQREFASTFTNPGTGRPYSQSQVVAWRRVGAVIALDMPADVQAYVSSNGNDSALGQAIDSATSKTAVVKALAAHRKASKAPAKVKGAQSTSSEKASDKVPAGAVAIGRNDVTRVESLETILAGFSANPGPKTRKALAEVVERIGVIVGVQYIDASTVTVAA